MIPVSFNYLTLTVCLEGQPVPTLKFRTGELALQPRRKYLLRKKQNKTIIAFHAREATEVPITKEIMPSQMFILSSTNPKQSSDLEISLGF